MKRLALRLLLLLVPLAVALPAHANHWFPCGDITQIGWSCQLAAHPSTHYEYGIAYATAEPQVVTCSYWNYGMRVSNRLPFFVFSENPSTSMKWGGFTFYTSTLASDDDTCSNGTWRHRFWWLGQDNVVVPGWAGSCHGTSLTIYCRAR